MEQVITWVKDNWETILAIYAGVVTIASYIVKLVPTLPEKHWALPFVKFLAVWVAVNQSTPSKRPKN